MLILSHHDCLPELAEGVFLAPNATLIGEVTVGRDSSIWFNAIIRADINTIHIGERTNIQDGVVVHVSEGDGHTTIGNEVTVGHNAVLHGCTVEDGCLIGMQSTVLDGSVVGARSLVAAGSLVPPRMIVPPGSLVMGSPARVMRPLTDGEQAGLRQSALRYVNYSQDYVLDGTLPGQAES